MEKFGLGLFIGALISVYIYALIDSTTIQPIEVYQGKTTLEYKIVDGEVVDSCVVYKQKY